MGTPNQKSTVSTHRRKNNSNSTLCMVIKSRKNKIRLKIYKNKPKTIKKMSILVIINTLNINGLNAPTKRHRLAEWIQKQQDPYICCLQETHFRPQDTYRLKVRRCKKVCCANRNQKKAGIAILILEKSRL